MGSYRSGRGNLALQWGLSHRGGKNTSALLTLRSKVLTRLLAMYIFGVKNLSHKLADQADYSFHIPAPKSQITFPFQYPITEWGLTGLQYSGISRNQYLFQIIKGDFREAPTKKQPTRPPCSRPKCHACWLIKSATNNFTHTPMSRVCIKSFQHYLYRCIKLLNGFSVDQQIKAFPQVFLPFENVSMIVSIAQTEQFLQKSVTSIFQDKPIFYQEGQKCSYSMSFLVSHTVKFNYV